MRNRLAMSEVISCSGNRRGKCRGSDAQSPGRVGCDQPLRQPARL